MPAPVPTPLAALLAALAPLSIMTRALATFWLLAAGACVQEPARVRLERINTLEVGGGVTCAAAFTRDGRAIATASERGDLMLIDLPARTVRWRATPGDHWVGELKFAPDGRTLACKGRHLTLHDADDGREIDQWSDAGPCGFGWNKDGSRFAFACQGGLRIIDRKSKENVAVAFDYPVNSLAWAEDGTLFAGDNVGRTWRIAAGAAAATLLRERRTKESDMVRSIALVWAGVDLFDLASDGTLFRGDEAVALQGKPYYLAVAADGRSFAVGGGSNTLYWWRQRGAEPVAIDVGANVSALAFAPDAHTLFAATAGGTQALHRDGAAPVELPGQLAPVHDFAMSPDGSVIAIGGGVSFGGAQVWSALPVQGGAPRPLLECREVWPGRRGSELLVCGARRLALVDGRTGGELVGLDEPTGLFTGGALGPGDRLFCGSRGALVEPRSGAQIPFPKDLLLYGVTDVAFGRDGLWAVGACCGIEGDLGALWVTDAEGRTLHTDQEGPVYSLAFSPDGKRLYCTRGQGMSVGMGPPEHVLCVFDTANFALLQKVHARIGPWRFLDDTRALTTANGLLQVWNATTLQAEQTIPTDQPVHGFVLSADGRTIAWTDRRAVFVHRVHRGD